LAQAGAPIVPVESATASSSSGASDAKDTVYTADITTDHRPIDMEVHCGRRHLSPPIGFMRAHSVPPHRCVNHRRAIIDEESFDTSGAVQSTIDPMIEAMSKLDTVWRTS
jgi:hypothetical protein